MVVFIIAMLAILFVFLINVAGVGDGSEPIEFISKPLKERLIFLRTRKKLINYIDDIKECMDNIKSQYHKLQIEMAQISETADSKNLSKIKNKAIKDLEALKISKIQNIAKKIKKEFPVIFLTSKYVKEAIINDKNVIKEYKKFAKMKYGKEIQILSGSDWTSIAGVFLDNVKEIFPEDDVNFLKQHLHGVIDILLKDEIFINDKWKFLCDIKYLQK